MVNDPIADHAIRLTTLKLIVVQDISHLSVDVRINYLVADLFIG